MLPLPPAMSEIDACTSSPCAGNMTCRATGGGDYICEPSGGGDDGDFPWLPVIIAACVALGVLLLALLLYCCVRYCRRMEFYDDSSSTTSSSRSSSSYEKKPVKKPAKKPLAPAIKLPPPQPQPQPLVLLAPQYIPEPVMFEPPPLEVWRSNAVFTTGLQYPHVIVGDYPLNEGPEVNVAVPFVDGTVEEHPAYAPMPKRRAILAPVLSSYGGPVPSIVASLGPAQGSMLASEVRAMVNNTPIPTRTPMVIQELDEQGHVMPKEEGTATAQRGILIGEERHVSYDTLPI